jgi:hypothetical protein
MTNNDNHGTDLNDVGVLRRREIEARIVAPLLDRLGDEFGQDRVRELAAEVIIDVAKSQGAAMAEMLGGNDLATFVGSMEAWTRGGALEMDVVEQSATRFAFNVTRCKYAEMYRSLGDAELGATMSCNRDGTMIEGFNPDITFTRTQTIMGGATHCDFVYELPESEQPVDL